MSASILFRYVFAALLFVCVGNAQEWRTWTDQKGRTIEAQIVAVSDGTVSIQKRDGQAYEFPLNLLSGSDQAYVREFAASGGSTDAHSAYPEFSWDRIPLYMHIRKDSAYSDEEISFIAKFPLITFEKSNGHKSFGSTEEGTLVAARKVKELNPRSKILYYRNVLVHYGSYAANEAISQMPEALLRDQEGNDRLVRNLVPAYDLSNAQVRKWWVDQCKRMTDDPAIDGVFFDGNVKALEPGYLRREIGQEKKEQVEAGYKQMMQQTREAIGSDKLMIANILRARFEKGGLEYMHYFDGSYLEGFFHNVGRVSYEDYVAEGIATMQQAARAGKIIAFTSSLSMTADAGTMGIDEVYGQAESDLQAQEALTYTLAIFLVCAEEYSYFRAHEGYSANGNKRWMRWFAEYDKPLGPPKGPAKQDGFKYTRSFEHATVSVDIQQRTADIQWR